MCRAFRPHRKNASANQLPLSWIGGLAVFRRGFSSALYKDQGHLINAITRICLAWHFSTWLCQVTRPPVPDPPLADKPSRAQSKLSKTRETTTRKTTTTTHKNKREKLQSNTKEIDCSSVKESKSSSEDMIRAALSPRQTQQACTASRTEDS